jgi:integrase
MPKRRGDGDGSIAQRADGRWHARLRCIDPITGLSRRLHFYARSRQEVVDELDAARRRLRAKKSPRDERITLAYFLRLWLADVVTPTKREWTRRQYESIIENHLIPSKLGSMQLSDMRKVQIQHLLVAQSKATPRIQQLCLIVLRRALAQAVEWNLLESNPAIGISPPRIAKDAPHVLSPEKARALLDALRGDRLFALFYLALDTGMRQGELLALRWDDIDLEAGAIHVTRTINTATGKTGPPKTKASRRRIDLDAAVIPLLVAHGERMRNEGYSGALVFPSTNGQPLSPSNVRIRSFLPAQAKAKIEPPIRFHDLRHTAATLMLGAGINPKIASERLGHATIAITMDTYQHVSPSMQREAARRVRGLLLPNIGSKGVKSGRQATRARPKIKRKTPTKRHIS